MKIIIFLITISLLSSYAENRIADVLKGKETIPKNTGLKNGLSKPGLDLGLYKILPDFELEVIATEPVVAQPIHVSFDSKGRLWLTQYRQYPFPAGVKVIGKDKYWRAIYDKVSPPPPNHFKGKDKITVFEDTNGDGTYDSHSHFLENLNMATAALPGKDGVWVLMMPYLLFYPDKNNDAVPDGPPSVHLEGFGMEDAHAVAASLHFGPDGWIYGSQGSTCTSTVKRFGMNEKGTHFKGHCIWRYHPTSKVFEIFAEGGGNTFSVSFDKKGNIFAGANGAALGYHFIQHGAYRKMVKKHGSFMNPYYFGTLPSMVEQDIEKTKLSQPFTIYVGDSFPDQYRGAVFSGRLLTHKVVSATLSPNGSTYKAHGLPSSLTSTNKSFRPVIIKCGPDGSVYMGDWWDTSISHSTTMGKTTHSTGRLYRLKAKAATSVLNVNLDKKTTDELLELLKSENGWLRRTALRLIGERGDNSIVRALKEKALKNIGQTALEYLWAVNLLKGFDEEFSIKTLKHTDSWVRYWSVRLIGDSNKCTSKQQEALVSLAKSEETASIRSQLLSTTMRLPEKESVPIVMSLLVRDLDFSDPQIPFMCWLAFEKISQKDPLFLSKAVNSEVWRSEIFTKEILPKYVRKVAEIQEKDFYQSLKNIYKSSPVEYKTQIEHIFVKYYAGLKDQVSGFFFQWLEKSDKNIPGGKEILDYQEGKPEAIAKALKLIKDKNTPTSVKLSIIKATRFHYNEKAIPELISIVQSPNATEPLELRFESIKTLQGYNKKIVYLGLKKSLTLPSQDLRVIDSIHSTMISREEWKTQYIKDALSQQIPTNNSPQIYQKLLSYSDSQSKSYISKIWGQLHKNTEEKNLNVESTLSSVLKHKGDPVNGKKLFMQRCVMCHKMGAIGRSDYGPDLIGYERDNKRYFIRNILYPSDYVREGYSLLALKMKDGSVNVGIQKSESASEITLSLAPEIIKRFSRRSIQDVGILPNSPMNPGLFNGLKVEEIANLLEFIKKGK